MERPQQNSVHDVVAYLRQRGITNAWSLEKVLFYCQAWSLVWDGVPMFEDDFQAWRDGPVCPEVYFRSRAGDPALLSAAQLATAQAVVDLYGSKSSDWLVALTHREEPWLAARGGSPPQAYGSEVITKDSMAGFYRRYGVAPKRFSEAFKAGLEVLATTPENVVYAEDTHVEAEPFLAWLKTGVGNPCASS